MKNLNNKVNSFFSNIDALASLIFRFGIGIAFIIHGTKKFPLPPQGLIEYFGLSPMLASTVALSELLSGLVLIVSGFIKNPFGNILTRLSGLNIAVLMISILVFAHKDWFFTTKLFTSEQIFLLIGGVYFLIKGNRT
jgi:uncharacterized membrane protein YphA (DoxX/SURF4 family)